MAASVKVVKLSGLFQGSKTEGSDRDTLFTIKHEQALTVGKCCPRTSGFKVTSR